jgi:predicted nuclease with TOPRIM domain
MTQANEPNERNQDIDRQLRDLRRRTERLEYLQIPPQEFSRSFDRVYDEIDTLEDIVNERFDRVNERFDRVNESFDQLKGEVGELNRKFDIVMQYITGQGGAN